MKYKQKWGPDDNNVHRSDLERLTRISSGTGRRKH
jgi:hypothetical protein